MRYFTDCGDRQDKFDEEGSGRTQGAGYELGLEQRRFQLGCDGFRCLNGVSTAARVDESGSATSMSSAFISLR